MGATELKDTNTVKTESEATADPSLSRPGPRNLTTAIFLISVLGLFLELLLIRWIGTEIRIFAYLQNTVLVVCFLGLGMGCFTSRKPILLHRTLVPLLVLAMLMAIPFTRRGVAEISGLLSVLDDFLIWEAAMNDGAWATLYRVTLGLGMTFFLMLLLWEVFVPLGRILGRLMNQHPKTIAAYSVNVAGSLVGILLFTALSVLSTPPVVWFAVVAALLFWFLGTGRTFRINLALTAGIALSAWIAGRAPDALEVAWSPYQKLALKEKQEGWGSWAGKYLITVNNVGYQGIIDLSEQAVEASPDISPEDAGLSQYDLPMLVHPNPKKVLIVGAGSGNDVAGALRGGAESVTAVEIDPAIIDIGRRYHPEKPYDSPKVRIVIDDARSFFARTNEQFDVVIFGLLDSHTTTAMTNARLDHYVYTQESIQRARTLLADGGVMVLSFEAKKAYIADRMGRVVRDVFGAEPIAFRVPVTHSGWGGAMFLAGDMQVVHDQLAANSRLAEKIAVWTEADPLDLTYTTRSTTDDWPYVYLKSAKIPSLFYLLAGLMVALTLYCRRRIGEARLLTNWNASTWHFFFLGAAFLLLEVQNISKASVVLGNTWVVNAVIISGILTMILLANFIAARFRNISENAVVGCLIGSCLGLYFLDISRFAFLPYLTKAVIVGGLTTLPILFSGIIFIRSFSRVESKDTALGANLMGSVVGGVLQSVTFLVGIKALLLIVAGLYLAAVLTRPRSTIESELLTSKARAAQPDSDSDLDAILEEASEPETDAVPDPADETPELIEVG